MENLQFLCNESRVEDNQNIYGRFKLFPFIPGQAVTLVNGLRRCLLSEVSGIAITAIKIKGVTHEYSTIVGLRESVLDLLLNVKQVVLTSEFQFEQPQVAYLRVQGPGIVRASDIKLPMSIQNVKPEQYIATLLYDGVLDIKFMICRGKNSLVQTPRGLKTPKVLKTNSPHQINGLQNKANHIKFSYFLSENFNKIELTRNRLLITTALHTFLKQKHKKKIKPYADLIFLRLTSPFERTQDKFRSKFHTKNFPKYIKERSDRVRKKKAKRMQTNLMIDDAFVDAVFLPIDAVFAPVLKVNFAIEENDLSNAPKECVILEIWTNGSIHPIQAIVEAGKALTNIMGLLKPMDLSKSVFINSLKSFNKALAYNKILNKKEQSFKSFKDQINRINLIILSKYSNLCIKKGYPVFRSVFDKMLNFKLLALRDQQTLVEEWYLLFTGKKNFIPINDLPLYIQHYQELLLLLDKGLDLLQDKGLDEMDRMAMLKKFLLVNYQNRVFFRVEDVNRVIMENFPDPFASRETIKKQKTLLKSSYFYRLLPPISKRGFPLVPLKNYKEFLELIERTLPVFKLPTKTKSFVKSHLWEMQIKLSSSSLSSSEKIDFSVDIGNLDLSLRSYTCLKKAKIENLSDLLQNSAEDLLNLKGFGKVSLNEVENSLHQFFLRLKS